MQLKRQCIAFRDQLEIDVCSDLSFDPWKWRAICLTIFFMLKTYKINIPYKMLQSIIAAALKTTNQVNRV